ncbi:hypothetical protein [Micromonospora costi]|uniref:Uncharacterized protein n=1 Tax=Micromonospora costi TaxID=1530042 RepID=A0A3B0ACC7_9ACTN|nr:hypothetical protein [Micromonospora costi]RKN58195.1 hypothetical protein D7193_06295 [Micromonospora costi]
MRVHDLVESATSDEPAPRYTVDDIVAAGRRMQRRRRAGWSAASAAVAVTGVVAAIGIGLQGVAERPAVEEQPAAMTSVLPAASPSRPAASWAFDDPFSYVFEGYDAGRLHVKNPIVVSSAYQIAPLHVDGLVTNDRAVDPAEAVARAKKGDSAKTTESGGDERQVYAYLTVYRPGAFDAAKFTGTRVTVDGHQAVEQEGPRYGANLHRALAWEYTEGAWAVAESFAEPADVSAADLRGLVAGLRPSVPLPARVPFTVGYLPAGYHAAELGQHAFAGLNGIASAGDGNYGGAIFANPALPTTGLVEPYGGVEGEDPPGSFTIFVLPNDSSNQALKDGEKAPAEPRCGNGFCNAWTADGKTSIQVASEGRLSDAEMTRILEGITLADVTDDSTWPIAATALRGN